MSQISYDIVGLLSKGSNHIRGLAKALGTNQMAIFRAAKVLDAQNIVDFRIEGKNKVYFLKDSLEAQEFVFSLEHLRLIEILRLYPRLRKIVEAIKKDSGIGLAMLFGSYAKKTPSKTSDIDIYADVSEDLQRKLELLDSKLSIHTGKFNKKSPLSKEIIKNHVIIKGVERYYELIHKET